MAVGMNVHTGPDYSKAPNPVRCTASPSGKHWPRTVEAKTVVGHTKTSVCRHCNHVA